MPRVVLAGNNLAAVYTLDLLLEALTPRDLLAIAPHPTDRPEWQESLATHAGSRRVACLEPEDVNEPEVTSRVLEHDPDLVLSVYYTQLFRRELLTAIAGRALNFHPSLLPRHRGNAPLIWAIVEGDHVTGLSVHHIDAGVDTGNVIVRRPLPIHENDTGHLLHAKMAYLVRATAAEIIRDFKAGKPIPEGQQQSGLATTHSSRDPRVNHIAWSDPRERIRNVVRALAPPLPAAFALVAGTPLYIARVDPVGAVTASGEKAPGMVEIGPGGTPIVWAGDGALRLTSVLADGRSVSAETLVESGHIAEGQVFD
jgi:methionyl-tRNA formyltransferase